jgi:hypothetical protein
LTIAFIFASILTYGILCRFTYLLHDRRGVFSTSCFNTHTLSVKLRLICACCTECCVWYSDCGRLRRLRMCG